MLGSATVCLLALASACAEITPESVYTTAGKALQVTCRLQGAPLDGCRFRVWSGEAFGESHQTEIMDFGSGRLSGVTAHSTSGRFMGSYLGRGLAEGDCGALFKSLPEGRHFVGCQFHVTGGEWHREYMALVMSPRGATEMITNTGPFPIQTLGWQSHHRSDHRVLTFVAGVKLQECKVYLPTSESFRLNKDSQGNRGSPTAKGDSYYGDLKGNTCSVRQRTAWTGPVWVSYRGVGDKSWRLFPPQIIVREVKPTGGTISVDERPNGRFTATCSVDGAAPAARLRWVIGNRVVRENNSDNEEAWAWPWDSRPITQRLTFDVPLGAESKVECRVFHPDWNNEVLPGIHKIVRNQQKAIVTASAPPVAERGCFALAPPSLRVRCSLGRAVLDCARVHVPPGTTARLQCRPGFRAQSDQPISLVSRCTAGEWRPQPIACDLDCGERGASKSVLISGGSDAAVAEFPWHVGVYRSLGADQYSQDCGGTLISQTLVVTAAHCFWVEARRKLNNHTLYKMVAGKHLRSWSEQEVKAQVRDVAEIHVPQRFRGRRSNYQYDIAVVRVSSGFERTSAVKPVCMDWAGQHEAAHMSAGVRGTVAGWGVSASGTFEEVLQTTDLPFVDFETCFGSLPDEAEVLFTDDKFCAGVANASRSVCRGDSGGGLVFATDGRYYLQGIVSVSFTPAHFRGACFSQLYTGFTSVSQYLPWIKTLDTIESDKVCSPIKKRHIHIGIADASSVIVKETRYFDTPLEVDFNCKFKVETANSMIGSSLYPIYPEDGVFAVIQTLSLRQDPSTGLCIDYIQFRREGASSSRTFCGQMSAWEPSLEPASTDQLAPFAVTDSRGRLDVFIHVDKQPLKRGEKLDFTIAFTSFKECSGTKDYLPCVRPSEGPSEGARQPGSKQCIWHSLFNDSVVNCPYRGCPDEPADFCPTNSEEVAGGNGVLVAVSALASLVIAFAVFLTALWALRKLGRACWGPCVPPPEPGLPLQPLPRAPSPGPTAPPPDPDKDLPPPYESLFPSQN